MSIYMYIYVCIYIWNLYLYIYVYICMYIHANWYKCYLQMSISIATALCDRELSFIEFCRKYHYDDNAKKVYPRVYGRAKHLQNGSSSWHSLHL